MGKGQIKMSRIQVPVQVLTLSREERERVAMSFYVKRDGDTLFFCYAYPEYGQEYIQKTWDVDPTPIYQPTIKVHYRDNEEIVIPKRDYQTFKQQLCLSDNEVWVVGESSETVFSIREISDEGKERYFNYPSSLIIDKINSRTFEAHYG